MVTDQWEVYENFYGQGVNQEIIRYIEGVLPRFDQHVDINSREDRLNILPIILEDKECSKINIHGDCDADQIEKLLDAENKDNLGQSCHVEPYFMKQSWLDDENLTDEE